MNNLQAARRRFLLAALTFSGLGLTGTSWLRSSLAWAESGDSATLTRFARLLLPHDGLGDDVYAEVMDGVLTSLAASAATKDLLHSAIDALDVQQEGNWFDAHEAAQIAAIRGIEGEAFFGTILATVRGAFYYNPRVWQHIDYPGSSKEYGGYIHRGFNDIAWLPEED